MALSSGMIPYLLGSRWWDAWDFPMYIFDQDFGEGLNINDVFAQRLGKQKPRSGHRGTSEVLNESGKFRVMLDVSQFSPSDISVKLVDNCVVVNGKHEEKADEHGFIAREFTRRYMLPQEVELEKLVCSLIDDGFLKIEAPKKPIEPEKPKIRNVPITVEHEKSEAKQIKAGKASTSEKSTNTKPQKDESK